MADGMKNLGQLFMVGFPGEKPSDEFLNFITEENIGGVILFEENCKTHQIARDNVELLKSAVDTNLLISIDQEGGRVSRLSGAPAEISSAWDYGNKLGLEKFAEDYNRCLLFLDSIGININLFPVGDIFLNNNNSCLEGRCFGETAEAVIPFVKKAIELSTHNQLISCVKHFPGLGESEIDPHRLTAEADYDYVIWEQREKTVYEQAIEAGVDLIMTTHLHLPKIDSTIATGSKKIVSGMIRESLGFDGLVITDDLNMKGADILGGIGERTVKAFNAGHDILLFSKDIENSMKAYDYFCDAVNRKEIEPRQIASSLERVAGLKFKLGKSIMM